jgi:hypothetical protein
MRPSLHANCEQLMGISAMSMKWIFSSTFLPHTGEPKDFQLEEGHPLDVFLAGASHAALSSNAQPQRKFRCTTNPSYLS